MTRSQALAKLALMVAEGQGTDEGTRGEPEPDGAFAELADPGPGAGAVLEAPAERIPGSGTDEPAAEAPATEGAEPAGDALSDAELLSAVTALVYASDEPLSGRRLQALLGGPSAQRVEAALAALRERLAATGLPLELRAIAGGHQILTTPDVGSVVQLLSAARRPERISGAALETLAVIAYRQPVTKAEIEAIRGVQAGPLLRALIERGLARVTGRSDAPGHPLQYGTTREFLERFGLGSLDELPRDGELAKD